MCSKMKNSKILKILSYLLIPIFIAVFIVSMIFSMYQDEWIENKENISDGQQQELVFNFYVRY